MKARVIVGDCRLSMAAMEDASVDAIVCDPPYELGFMGKKWDASDIAFDLEVWRQALRVLKPGGHLLAFSGTRTYHRMTCAIEDAGFEIRDCIGWHYGSGFPKSLDVSKAIDKAAGAEREVVGERKTYKGMGGAEYDQLRGVSSPIVTVTAPATDAAAKWQGWGTALKPAWEPIVVARKPLEGTVAGNVLKHGTGAMNIDGCRIATSDPTSRTFSPAVYEGPSGYRTVRTVETTTGGSPFGRWPANIILSHAPDCEDGVCVEGCPCAEMDRQSGELPGRKRGIMHRGIWSGTSIGGNGVYGTSAPTESIVGYSDSGGASRFFSQLDYEEADFPSFYYTAKASRREREAGCEALPARSGAEAVEREEGSAGTQSPRAGAGRTASEIRNAHPTVKPIAVMAWLVRLVTPKDGVVLDPFTGSGTTGVAALREGMRFVGCELSEEYAEIARARMRVALGPLFASEVG